MYCEFYFVDMKFQGLMIINMLEDTWTIKLNQHFIGILNL